MRNGEKKMKREDIVDKNKMKREVEEDTYQTPEPSMWSSMTSALSRDLGEFVSEVKKDLFDSRSNCDACRDLMEENIMLKKKIETLQAEIERLKQTSSAASVASSGSWVKPTIEPVEEKDEPVKEKEDQRNEEAVSYTHLTLPTTMLV